ncbi:MAG: neuraminidase-like domain-containing protein [Promethearchaeota archaeon]
MELKYLIEHHQNFENFDLNSDINFRFNNFSFQHWERFYDVFNLKGSLKLGENDIIAIFKTATDFDENIHNIDDELSKLKEVIKQFTRWNSKDLDYLIDTLITRLGDFVNVFKNEIQLIKLKKCLDLSNKLGISAQKVKSWAHPIKSITTPEDNEEIIMISEEIKKSVKAKYEQEIWIKVVKSLRNMVREKQRNALVSYILNMKQLNNPNELFDELLIDVKISSCKLTSRIAQAISTLQLFIQRCLMNLEKDINPKLINSNRWKWMKNYRVWEANRKVFLYPENYIKFELLDNKSPFFKELENELLQTEVTNEAVKDIFLNYLEKLDNVANLEVCGEYFNEQKDIIYVFGKTAENPKLFYFRQFKILEYETPKGDNLTSIKQGYWTPWEKIDIDIEGEHLIPTIYYDRLFIFWIIFNQSAEQPSEGSDIESKWEIRLNWSEYKHNKWSAKKIASKTIEIRKAVDLFKKEDYTFSAWEQDDELIIGMYRDEPTFNFHYDQAGTPPEGWELITSGSPTGTGSVVDEYKGHYKVGKLNHGGEKGTSTRFRHEFEANFDIKKGTIEWWALVSSASKSNIITYVPYGGIICGLSEGNVVYYNGHTKNTISGFTVNEWHHFKIDFYCDSNNYDLSVDNQLIGIGISFWGTQEHLSSIYFQSESESTNDVYFDSVDFSWNPKVQGLWQFRLKSYQGKVSSKEWNGSNRTRPQLPINTCVNNMALKANEETELILPLYDIDEDILYLESPALVILSPNLVSGNWNLIYSHQYWYTGENEIKYVLSYPQYSPFINQDGEKMFLQSPFFYQDGRKAFFIIPKINKDENGDITPIVIPLDGVDEFTYTYFKFNLFYHPHVPTFIKELYKNDIRGLLECDIKYPSCEDLRKAPMVDLSTSNYIVSNKSLVYETYPPECIDFSSDSAYSLYNWELFFHIPLLIATSLSNNQRFEDAQQWFHYIFNPTKGAETGEDVTDSKPQQCWRFKPFYDISNNLEETDLIQELMELLYGPDNEKKQRFINQVEQWKENPFNPHLIARLRIGAYQKTVVMKYIDNLIAWGDYLFRQFQNETINEATQLYILAYEILGPRPETIPSKQITLKSYRALSEEFSKTLAELENQTSTLNINQSNTENPDLSDILSTFGPTSYFCIPRNDTMLSYWDIIEDRLFKIRHCMNIEGVVSQPLLFAPPIPPELLVRAKAMGVDISSILSDIDIDKLPTPHYRFPYMLQKAKDFCNEVKSLGSLLLSALEKKDAEELSLIRAGQETNLLKAIRVIKQKRIDEAQATFNSLDWSLKVREYRKEKYRGWVYAPWNPHEQAEMNARIAAITIKGIETLISLVATILLHIPEIKSGISGGLPTLLLGLLGGKKLSRAEEFTANTLDNIYTTLDQSAILAGIQGKKWWDVAGWKLEYNIACREIEEVKNQKLAAEIRWNIADKDLENHDQQINNAREIDDWMRSKFTNQDLYSWMVSQISTVYFQSYQLAYEMAKKAEKAYQFELGQPSSSSSFIQFGYWDNLKKGLLAGEKLYYDLNRLEMAYIDRNEREYEITKTISLSAIEPLALFALREKGICSFRLGEEIFDYDYPGHYMRRIKTLSLTIPCTKPPNTNINCTLTLNGNTIRIKDTLNDGSYLKTDHGEDRFIDDLATMQSIATSQANDDFGLFQELDFSDERYLPFEGAGVESTWYLEMPIQCNNFDFNTILDVLITIRYTARAARDDDTLKKAAMTTRGLDPGTEKQELIQLFSAKYNFPDSWQRFFNPLENEKKQILELNLIKTLFPYRFKTIDSIDQISIILILKEDIEYEEPLYIIIDPQGMSPSDPRELNIIEDGITKSPYTNYPTTSGELGKWLIEIDRASNIENPIPETLRQKKNGVDEIVQIDGIDHYRLNLEAVKDLGIIIEYSATLR